MKELYGMFMKMEKDEGGSRENDDTAYMPSVNQSIEGVILP